MALCEVVKYGYKEYQIEALRKEYSDEEINLLSERWQKPLLYEESVYRDKQTHRVIDIGIHRKTVLVDNCSTFQQLLTARLMEIEPVIPPMEDNIKLLDAYLFDARKEWRRKNWALIERLFSELHRYGLDMYAGGEDDLCIDFRFARLNDLDLSAGFFDGAKFDGSDCSSTRFVGADCSGASFIGATLHATKFSNSFTVDAMFNGAELTSGQFYCADCRGSHFDRALCFFTHFHNAICTGAFFDGTDCQATNFTNATLHNTSFCPKEIIEQGVIKRIPCNLSNTIFMGASFIGVDTSNVDWSTNQGMKQYIEHQQLVEYAEKASRKHFLLRVLFFLWGSMTGYGKDSIRLIEIGFLSVLVFGVIYNFLFFWLGGQAFVSWDPTYAQPNILSFVYYSLTAFASLGSPDILPVNGIAKVVSVVEMIFGYFTMASLVTFLANWLGRR